MDPAFVLSGVTKTFGAMRAVDRLDLQVPRGTLCGVIGPNGAGKTTTIRIVMSILFPDTGSVSVLGHRSALLAKDRIGYLPEERGLYRKMRVGEFLTYMARLKSVADGESRTFIARSLERLGLTGVEGKRCEELSKGMQQKVQFIAATVHRPDLLILDEPFSGLDPVSTRMLRELILDEHRRGATILFSTHVMPHAEHLCDRVVMIHQGRKVLDESVAAIRHQYDPRLLEFEPLDPAADLSPLSQLPGVDTVETTDGVTRVTLSPGSDPAAAIARITTSVPTARIEVARLRLEDVFVQLVAAEGEKGDAELRAGLRAAETVEAL
jgi:ABC-2 type transport system ATP-binding protein